MNGWINGMIGKARWDGFAVWFAFLAAFSVWAFGSDSPWTRALAAAGGKLPETLPGFPPIEPQRSLEALASAKATGEYILWQALDIPYAFLNLMVTSIAIALALKATGLKSSPLRFLLLLPLVYLICEFVEDGLVAAFAAKLLAPGETIVLAQQLATSVKLASGYGSVALALLSLVVAALAALIGGLRKRG